MSARFPDEYQDGTSTGSLINARRCWRDLVTTDELQLPQLFTFVFHCPTERMAVGLVDYLRYTSYAGYVRVANGSATPAIDPWRVTGTTHATVWSLASLEHLFMGLRRAGARYRSALVTLDLVTVSRPEP